MGKLTTFVLFAMCLVGCASGPAPAVHGNFVTGITTVDSKTMADDMAKKLATLYPPARIRINLQQPTPDAFGASLVTALRTTGYALKEFTSAKSAGATVSAAAPEDSALAY